MEAFKAIAHVFMVDDEGVEFYVDSYPMMKRDKRAAEKIFRAQGYFVGTRLIRVHVDDIEAFLFDGGTITMDEFQAQTGLDLVSWIWGVGPFPEYILKIIGQAPSAGVPANWSPEWARAQAERMTRSRTLLEAIERTIARRKTQFVTLFWSIATDLSKKLLRPGEERSLFMWLVDVFKESDIDMYD